MYNTVRKSIEPVTPIFVTYGEGKCIQLGTLQHLMAQVTQICPKVIPSMIMQTYEANERLRCITVRKGIKPVTSIWVTYGERKSIQLGTLQHIMVYMTYENMTIMLLQRGECISNCIMPLGHVGRAYNLLRHNIS